VERQEGEEPNDTPSQDLSASAKRPHADDEDRASKLMRVDAAAHKSPENSRDGAKRAATPGSVVYTSDGYPLRPGEPDCDYYLQHGRCGFGWNCKFNHPEKHGPKQIPAVEPLLYQGMNSSGERRHSYPFADAAEAAEGLCSYFNLADEEWRDEPLRKRLSRILIQRSTTLKEDMAQLYHQLSGKEVPAAYLKMMIKRMENDTFVWNSTRGNAGRFDHGGDDRSPDDQNSRSRSRSSQFSI
jgi:hypothetical protein